MEGGAFQPVLLDPVGRVSEDVRPVVIESEHEASVHLNTMVVQKSDATGIFLSAWTLLPRGDDVVVLERLEPNEHACAAGQGHFAHKRWIVRHVDRNCGAPDLLQRSQSVAQSA